MTNEQTAAGLLAKKADANLKQVRRVLISQSAQLWVDYWGLARNEQKLMQLDAVYSSLRNHYREAYEAGLVPYNVYLDANNNHKNIQTRLYDIHLAKQKSLQIMNALRGRYPADEFSIQDDRIPLKMVAYTGMIPASVLADRPDIQAAFMELLAFDYFATAAHKALLPRINLNGSMLKSSVSLEKVSSGDLVWQLVGGLTQPLFNAGQLKAIAMQKSAEAEASWWRFQHVVLQAMLEVEQALASERSITSRLTEKKDELADMNNKFRSTEERFADGDLPISDYLEIRAERIETQIELTKVQIEYIDNRIHLVTALGLPIDMNWKKKSSDNNEKS